MNHIPPFYTHFDKQCVHRISTEEAEKHRYLHHEPEGKRIFGKIVEQYKIDNSHPAVPTYQEVNEKKSALNALESPFATDIFSISRMA